MILNHKQLNIIYKINRYAGYIEIKGWLSDLLPNNIGFTFNTKFQVSMVFYKLIVLL
jgi:hypothetical protein